MDKKERNGTRSRLFADLTTSFPEYRNGGLVKLNLGKVEAKCSNGFGMLAIVKSLAVPEVKSRTL